MVRVSSSELSSGLAGGADTIVARATPAGRGGLAVIRVSGPRTAECAAEVCPGHSFDAGWKASLTTLRDRDQKMLERGVVITYPGPRSYTGEDMLEVTVHGSPFLVEAVVDAFVAAGARPAEPGEFTRRAVANGKLDLVQAEAIRDLVAADTAWQLRNAREQLAGALSNRFRDLRAVFVAALGAVEASLDYESQGVEVPTAEISADLAACRAQLDSLLATAVPGARIREGLRVVILGPPNAGKSTLFNRLCGSERAIVSPHPGTTRDVIEAELDVGGVRVVVQDTAGLRAGGDDVEIAGQRRANAAAATADLAILVSEASAAAADDLPESLAGLPRIRVLSKSDLRPGEPGKDGWLRVSCHSGEGLEELRQELRRRVLVDVQDLGGGVAIAERHRRALEVAANELATCDPSCPETTAEGLRWALRAIERLVGEVADDDVLDEIFGTFCIGK